MVQIVCIKVGDSVVQILIFLQTFVTANGDRCCTTFIQWIWYTIMQVGDVFVNIGVFFFGATATLSSERICIFHFMPRFLPFKYSSNWLNSIQKIVGRDKFFFELRFLGFVKIFCFDHNPKGWLVCTRMKEKNKKKNT